MALADAAAPEGVVLAVRQDDIHIQAGQGEETGIPAGADNRGMRAQQGSLIHIGKVFRHPGMGIKGIHHVEALRQHGGHFRQIRSAAAADDNNVNLTGVVFHVLRGIHRRAGQGFHRLRIPAGKHAEQLRVRILPDRQFHTPSKVTITIDCNFHSCFSLP